MPIRQPFSRALLTSCLVALVAAPALAVDATAVSDVNVRSGPGVGYSRLDTLYGGEMVDITECQSGWCYVEHDGPDGWVSGNYLSATGSAGGGGESVTGSAAGDAAAAIILGTILNGIFNHGSTPPPPAAPPLPYGPDTCNDGFVWRDAIPGDHVCVTPASRSEAAHENAIAGSRVDPTGAYGPNTCKPGFVWRESYSGDVVCVTGARRSAVQQENIDGPSHRVAP